MLVYWTAWLIYNASMKTAESKPKPVFWPKPTGTCRHWKFRNCNNPTEFSFLALSTPSLKCVFCSDNWSKFEAPTTGQVGTHRTLQQVHIWGSGKVRVGRSSKCRWLLDGTDLHCAEGKSATATLQYPVHYSVCQPTTAHVGRGWILLHKSRESIIQCSIISDQDSIQTAHLCQGLKIQINLIYNNGSNNDDSNTDARMHARTHTHTTILRPSWILSGTTWVQSGFTGARDSEWQWHQLGHMEICTSPQSDNHASILPLSFLQAGCPSCHPPNSVNARRRRKQLISVIKCDICIALCDDRVHSMLEKSLKMLEFWIKNPRPITVLENR